MYAVVFEVDLKPGWQGDADSELDLLIGFVKAAPGFVRGTWTTDGSRGLSFILFDSESPAREFAANAFVPAEASVMFRSVNVYEVVRDV
jgi:hypothetical protein